MLNVLRSQQFLAATRCIQLVRCRTVAWRLPHTPGVLSGAADDPVVKYKRHGLNLERITSVFPPMLEDRGFRLKHFGEIDLGLRHTVESDPNYIRRKAILNSAQVIYAE